MICNKLCTTLAFIDDTSYMYMLIKYKQYVARGKVLHVPNKNRLIVVINLVTLTIDGICDAIKEVLMIHWFY